MYGRSEEKGGLRISIRFFFFFFLALASLSPPVFQLSISLSRCSHHHRRHTPSPPRTLKIETYVRTVAHHTRILSLRIVLLSSVGSHPHTHVSYTTDDWANRVLKNEIGTFEPIVAGQTQMDGYTNTHTHARNIWIHTHIHTCTRRSARTHPAPSPHHRSQTPFTYYLTTYARTHYYH